MMMTVFFIEGFDMYISRTVDGSEIRRSPVEICLVYPIIYEVLSTSKRWLFGISEPSTVSTHISYYYLVSCLNHPHLKDTSQLPSLI